MLSIRTTSAALLPPALCAMALALCAPACLGITAEEVVKRAMDLNEGIRDYRAQVTITTVAEKLDIPPRQVTIYYKRPDKMRVDSEQVAMIPRAAVDIHTLGSVAAKNSRAVMGGQKTVNGRLLYNIKLLPRDEDTKRGRALVWIWGDTWTVERMEAYEGDTRRFSVRWTYQRVGKYWMPQWIVFTTPGMGRRSAPLASGGEIRLYFSRVEVNVGLSDADFAEQ